MPRSGLLSERTGRRGHGPSMPAHSHRRSLAHGAGEPARTQDRGERRRRPGVCPRGAGASGERSGTAGEADRLAASLLRDGPTCVWCGRTFGPLVPPTTEHLVPRVKGGPSWTENEVAACSRCNGRRGHTTPVDWLAECRRRGWSPDADRVLACLVRLEGAVGRRGGQRRARPYLDGQLRRLRHRDDDTTT